MPRRTARLLVALLLLAGAAAAGACGSGARVASPVTTAASPAPSPPPPARADRGRHGGQGSGGRAGGAATLPAGWPPDLPLPPGALQSASGAGSSWSALLLVPGAADRALADATAFYRSAGYAPVTDGVLERGGRRITIAVENRDHSAGATFVAVAATGG